VCAVASQCNASQAAALLCFGRALRALCVLGALRGDLIAATAAFGAWTTALLLLSHAAQRHGAALVARPLFALQAAHGAGDAR
jgi:hypothetical protein